MRKSILVSFFILFQQCVMTLCGFGQSGVAWSTTGGGTLSQLAYEERGEQIIKTSDGGSIICGTTSAANEDVLSNHGATDIWVVKLYSNGSIHWQRSLGGKGMDEAASIAITQDGGYIIVGTTSSTDGDVIGNHGNNDIWVVKLSSTGTLQWQKCLGGGGVEEGTSIKTAADGGYIVSGHAAFNNGDVSGNHGGVDAWVIKLTNTGTIQWQKCLGGTQYDYGYSIETAADGGYILAGRTNSNDGDAIGNNWNEGWVVKLTSAGAIQWQKFLGGTGSDTFSSIASTSDGGYLLTGNTTSNNVDLSGNHGETDLYVVKLSDTGSVQWQKSFGGSGLDYGSEGLSTTDGGYIVSGYTFSNDGNVTGLHGSADFWVIKLSNNGSIQWQKCLGGTGDDRSSSVAATSDGGYALTGYTFSNNGDVSGIHGETDIWAVKLNSTGSLQWQKCLGGTGVPAYNLNKGLCKTPDGGAIAVGYTNTIELGEFRGLGLNALVTKYGYNGRIEWQKKMGGVKDDAGLSITTAEGGYVFTGYNKFYTDTSTDVPGNHGGDDVWVVKLSTTGTRLWQKCLGGSGDEVGNSIAATGDGGFILAGYTSSNNGDVSGNHGGQDVWVVKLSNTGAIEWQKCLGGMGNDVGNSILVTSDGGYILTGSTLSTDGDISGHHGGTDAWVVKLSANGAIQWQKSLGGIQLDVGSFITSSLDGGYILTGRTSSNDGDVSGNHGGTDAWVIKLSNNGNIQWQKCLGGTNYDLGNAIIPTKSGGYIFVGNTYSNDGDLNYNYGLSDAWVVTISDTGHIQWQSRFGGTDDDSFTSIASTSDSSYILSGYTYSKNYDLVNDTLSATSKTWSIKLKCGPLYKPYIIARNDSIICPGKTVLLEASYASGVTFKWFRNGILINGANSSSYQTDAPGAYTVRVFSTCNGDSATSESIQLRTVSRLDTLKAIAEGPLSFCDGGGVTLTSSVESENYRWYIDGRKIYDATSRSYRATQAGSYWVTNGCTDSAYEPVRVVVGTGPESIRVPYVRVYGDTTFCSGDSVLLEVSRDRGVNYQWLKNGILINGATDTAYRARTSGNYSVRLYSTCSGDTATSRGIAVNVNSLPEKPVITANGPLSFCNGDSVRLTSSASSGNQWYNLNYFLNGVTGRTYTVNWSGAFSVRVSNACGTVASDTIRVHVADAPAKVNAPYIYAKGDTTVCPGGSVLLQGGSWYGVNYKWFKDGILINGAIDSSYRASVGGLYSVRIISTCSGDSATSRIMTISVNTLPARPVITANRSLSICSGDSVVLTSSASSGNLWYRDGILISNATARNYTARIAGKYKVYVSNGCGTVASDSVIVSVGNGPAKVNAPSIWNVADTTTICAGGSVLLQAGWMGGVRYQWLKDGVVISGATDSSYRASTSGGYAVRVISMCSGDSATSWGKLVRVLTYPDSPRVTTSGPLSFCAGGSVTLTSTVAANYQWYRNGMVIPGATTQSYRVTTSGSYWVLTTNSCGNNHSTAVQVTVNATPAVPVITVSGNTLSSSAAAGNQWYKDGVAISGAASPQYRATAPGAYSVYVTQNGCTAVSATMNFVIKDTTTLQCPSNVVTFTNANQCVSVVNSVEPTLVPSTSASIVNYSLWGATTGSGTGSVSGKTFNKGVTWVNYRMADDTSKTCSFSVTVEDKEGPSIEDVTLSADQLWPPDHKMVDVTVNYKSVDACGGSSNCKLSVSSNEPQNGLGDGDTDGDWEVLDNHHIRLREERSGNGDGRIYTIKMECTDAAGNSSVKTAVVTVPKGQLETKAQPNPSPTEFTLMAKSVDNQLMVVRVLDMSGGLIETRFNVVPNSSIKLGKDYLPGFYYVEFIQGSTKRTVKVLKVGR